MPDSYLANDLLKGADVAADEGLEPGRSCSITQNNRAITALIGIDLGAGGATEIETDRLDPDPI